MSRSNHWQVAIIGAGPSGLAAALAAERQGLSTAVFESNKKPSQALGFAVITDKTRRQLQKLLGQPEFLSQACFAPTALTIHLGRTSSLQLDHGPGLAGFQYQTLHSALLEASSAKLFFNTRVQEAEAIDTGYQLRVWIGEELQEVTADMVIDASGRSFHGLPTQAVECPWAAWPKSNATFLARVELLTNDVEDPQPRYVIHRRYLARLMSFGRRLVVEINLRRGRDWKDVWREFVQFLSGPLDMRVYKENRVDFCWLKQAQSPDLGRGRLLRVGEAAGLDSYPGAATDVALQSGLAAGLACASLGSIPRPLKVYEVAAEPWRREAERVRTQGGYTDVKLLPGLSARQCLSQNSFFRRWRHKRSLRHALKCFLKTLSDEEARTLLPP